MATTLSVRRITEDDYPLIRYACICKLYKIQGKHQGKPQRKTWIDYVDIESVVKTIYELDTSYIVNEEYLVVYQIYTPWYNENITILSETLVGKLTPKATDFSVVPRFLESMAREAGCTLAFAGTALATSDEALASLYAKAGFRKEAIGLTKRI